jgi:hypothetical protein
MAFPGLAVDSADAVVAGGGGPGRSIKHASWYLCAEDSALYSKFPCVARPTRAASSRTSCRSDLNSHFSKAEMSAG